MNLKDMIYSLFGNYANTANVQLIPQKEFLNNAANGVRTVQKSSINAQNSKKVLDKLGEKQVKLFKATFGARSEIYEAIDVVKYLDVSQQIIETIVNDAFYSFDAEEPFVIEYVGEAYDAEEVNMRIQRTIQRLKLYPFFRDMVDDLVTYGEYYVETPCKEGLGIAELNDTVFVHNVISVYDNSELLYHIAERKTSVGTEVVQIDKDNLSHFVLDTKRIRLRSGKFDSITGVPEIIKVGRSVLLPVLKLLQRYNLLDIANIAHDLKTALMPPLVKLGITEQMTPDQIIETVKKYEEYFVEMGDALHSIDASKEISASEILRLATQIKVVPSSDKSGSFERVASEDNVNLNESQDRLEARIKRTVGIPTDEEAKSRLDNLREKSRYAKKLLDVQLGTGHSFVNLILKDLRYQGIIIDESNLTCKFKAIQNPNIEEDAEGMFHLATSARDVIRTYVETAEDIEGLKLNATAAKEFLDSLMSRYPQLENMLEAGTSEEEMDNIGSDRDLEPDDIENAGFVERDDDEGGNFGNGPESVGSEPEEPLIEPEEEAPEPAAEEPPETGEQ
jgi:hypothetical protein